MTYNLIYRRSRLAGIHMLLSSLFRVTNWRKRRYLKLSTSSHIRRDVGMPREVSDTRTHHSDHGVISF